MTLTDAELTYPPDGASRALVARLAPASLGDGTERRIRVDQTNRSVVVGERAIVKWLTPPAPEPHHGITVLRHLQAVGFAEMPALLGVEHADGHLVAIASEFVPDAVDGWEWFVDTLLAWSGGDVDPGYPAALARRAGRLVARLHAALATPSELLSAPTSVESGVERVRCLALLDEALDVVEEHDALAALVSRGERIRSVLAAMPTGATPAQVIHGDLHVGQLLHARDRMLVTDFDGNPLLLPAERERPRPAAVDVAALLQSIDHCARIAQRRQPGHAESFGDHAPVCTAAALEAYLAEAQQLGIADRLDSRLLPGLAAAQELHELIYASRHLPRWAYAPTATLLAMFPDA